MSIVFINIDFCQRKCFVEGRAVNTFNHFRKIDCLKLRASFKGKIANSFKLAISTDYNIRQAYIVFKGIFLNFGNVVRDVYCNQVGASLKGRYTDVIDTVGKADISELRLICKGKVTY